MSKKQGSTPPGHQHVVGSTAEYWDGGTASSVRNTLASVVSALESHPAWSGVLATDLADGRITFRRPPPFALGADVGDDPVAVRDRDLDRIRHWFEVTLSVRLSKQNVVDAVRIVADEHAFHPVRDYLTGLAWDGHPRISGWLERYAGVRPRGDREAALVGNVGRKWLISAVARAMQPGCKVDTMLILEGRQGIGKSRALATLTGARFFSDAAIDFGSKDACQTIQGIWILELAELDAILRRDPATVKAFLSRATDRFRVPYGRSPESVPRGTVFAGTVNHGAYLRDTASAASWRALDTSAGAAPASRARITTSGSTSVPVGTALSGRPPDRTRRADFPHRAPTSGQRVAKRRSGQG